MNTRNFSSLITAFAMTLPLLLTSCGGSTSGSIATKYLKSLGMTAYDLDTNIAALDPEVVVQQNDDGSIYLRMLVGVGGSDRSEQMATFSDLESISFVIFNKGGTKRLDSLHSSDVTKSGLGGTATSMMASAGVTWDPEETPPREFNLMTLIRSGSGMWLIAKLARLPELARTDPILLTLYHQEKSDGIKFTLTAKRVSEAPVTEFLPTGETFRIEVYDGPLPVWSSSDGKAFTQSTGPVEPEGVGERKKFSATWNGQTPTGPARNGVYTVVATIPAKPTPYTIRKEFDWKAK